MGEPQPREEEEDGAWGGPGAGPAGISVHHGVSSSPPICHCPCASGAMPAFAVGIGTYGAGREGARRGGEGPSQGAVDR